MSAQCPNGCELVSVEMSETTISMQEKLRRSWVNIPEPLKRRDVVEMEPGLPVLDRVFGGPPRSSNPLTASLAGPSELAVRCTPFMSGRYPSVGEGDQLGWVQEPLEGVGAQGMHMAAVLGATHGVHARRNGGGTWAITATHVSAGLQMDGA